MRCDWAGCRQTDTVPADGWWFCPIHLSAHFSLAVAEARPTPRAKDQARQEFLILYRQGLSDQQIATRMYYHESSVVHIRRMLGLPLNPHERQVAACGTRSGYQRHKREGTPLCTPCVVEERTYQRERGARRRAARLAS